MRVAGFVKLRNEILREGNLYRLLEQLEVLCDCGVICDDASSDGTMEIVSAWSLEQCKKGRWWSFLRVYRHEQSFQNEMAVKQRMLDEIHAWDRNFDGPPDWILWMDGDELFEADAVSSSGLPHEETAEGLSPLQFRLWLAGEGEKADVWAFHYTQLWRGLEWARTDDGFDNGWFWKLWRYSPDLKFAVADRLHSYQFPRNFYEPIMEAVNGHGGSYGRARRAPFEILHLGNVGKNLVWKAIQYRNSGPLEEASLKRHLYFGKNASYRRVDGEMLPASTEILDMHPIPEDEVVKAMEFTDQEKRIIERMGDLKQRPGLCVVTIPTFNRGPTDGRVSPLETAVRSVLTQTYENWICVVLDDGSTDATAGLMKSLTEEDPRIFYCRYEENRGGVAMNEIGCALACEFGEFWVRLGSDDYFKPHKLELDVLALDEFPRAVACYGPYRDLHGGNERDLRGLPSDVRGALLSHGFAASWANICVRISALREIRDRYGFFVDPEIRNMEDFLLNVRLAYLGEFIWRARMWADRDTSGGVVRKFIAAQLLGVPSVADLVRTEIGDLDDLDHDAVWRVAADGASQRADICTKDASITMARLQQMADAKWPDGTPKFPPTPREETTILTRPLSAGGTR